MELNAEQIKKALECCLVESNCTGCPLHHQYETDCLKYAGEKALSLIKELTEELDNAKRDTIPKLQWSLERANAMGVEADKKVAELTEENERLRDNLERTEKALITCDKARNALFTDTFRIEAEARADTVRKMQERLKAYFGTYVLGYKIPLTEELKAVNQIAKEMLEGANEN